MKYKSPCQYCKDRCLGCHSKCEKYLAFRSNIDEARAVKQKILEYQDAHYSNAGRNARRLGKPFGAA